MKRFIAALLTASILTFNTAFMLLADTSYADDPFLYETTSSVDAEADGVADFVTRLYSICLDRQPDQAGLNDWAGKLRSRQITGIEAAYGFIFSSEFQNRNLSNSDYVEKMYQAFLGRSSDEAGKAQWVSAMEGGMSRVELFSGFANSQEFTAICESYGIERGDYSPENGFVNTAQIKAFVTRLYDICLGRLPDENGLNDWTARLSARQITGTEAAAGFFFSPEYKNKNRSDADFVEDLYNCFLGRPSDTAGKSGWVDLLAAGTTDPDIFNGFSQSQEYSGICSSYGIERGGAYITNDRCRAGVIAENTPTPSPTPEPTQTPPPPAADLSGTAWGIASQIQSVAAENGWTNWTTSVLRDNSNEYCLYIFCEKDPSDRTGLHECFIRCIKSFIKDDGTQITYSYQLRLGGDSGNPDDFNAPGTVEREYEYLRTY